MCKKLHGLWTVDWTMDCTSTVINDSIKIGIDVYLRMRTKHALENTKRVSLCSFMAAGGESDVIVISSDSTLTVLKYLLTVIIMF